MGNMTCASYIEKRLNEQKLMIQKFAEDGIRAPKEEKDKLMALTKQDMVRHVFQ